MENNLDSEKNTSKAVRFSLSPDNNERLQNLCGNFDEHLRQIERRLGVQISNRGHQFEVAGEKQASLATREILKQLYQTTSDKIILPEEVHLVLQQSNVDGSVSSLSSKDRADLPEVLIKTRRGMISARGDNQREYLHSVVSHDINFGVGPAGTGKTYLAVACAVDALERNQVRRILLVRPAVEAGEKLGFLPGDLSQKIDPYLRPLYDALYEMLGIERVNKLIERNVIEVAPLAYMRGRTLNDAFIILDEAQNTTQEQMKMFLTRIGFGSTAVITGDVTQIDLPRGANSGLKQAIVVLDKVEGISFTHFDAKDVVRHELVKKVVRAYESFDLNNA